MGLPRLSRSTLALLLATALTVAVGACGKNKGASSGTGGGAGTASGGTGPGSGGIAGGGGAGGGLAPCVDLPRNLPRPPSDGLPCDLIPPGLAR